MAPPLTSLHEGATFAGRYQVVRCIRAGGMGAVYEVLHLETRRKRALKVMLPNLVHDDDMRRRFRAEATVASQVYSDHIVETFDAGIDAETGAPFLVMELLQGEELADVLTARGRFPGAEVLVFVRQVASALDKTHAQGIVHRDLKPENLFLTRADDGSPRLKVLDFGIAKVVESATQSGGANPATRSIGTPVYMAPEQIQGRGVVPATDLYALSLIAYTLLVGEPYFSEEQRADGNLFALLMKIAHGPQELSSVRARRRGVELAPGFDEWFARGTAVEPSGRFATARELAVALEQALLSAQPFAPTPEPARSAVVAPRQQPFASRPAQSTTSSVALAPAAASAGRGRQRRWLLLGGSLAAVAAIGVLAWALSDKPKKRPADDDDDDTRRSSEASNPYSDYIRRSKTAEAKNTLGAIARAAMGAYERESMASELLTQGEAPAFQHKLCGSATAVPARIAQAAKYMPSNAEGQDFNSGDQAQGWKCLKFTVENPIYYQYEYRVGKSYKGPLRGGPNPGPDGFEASAEGDLDGDGKTSLFTVTGKVDPVTMTVRIDPKPFVDDELE